MTSAGCCFIKYGTSAEADRAIRALHNQYTLPGVNSTAEILENCLAHFLVRNSSVYLTRELVLFKSGMQMVNVNALVIFTLFYQVPQHFSSDSTSCDLVERDFMLVSLLHIFCSSPLIGAVEYKLFVGSLNKQATEKEVEEVCTCITKIYFSFLMFCFSVWNFIFCIDSYLSTRIACDGLNKSKLVPCIYKPN